MSVRCYRINYKKPAIFLINQKFQVLPTNLKNTMFNIKMNTENISVNSINGLDDSLIYIIQINIKLKIHPHECFKFILPNLNKTHKCFFFLHLLYKFNFLINLQKLYSIQCLILLKLVFWTSRAVYVINIFQYKLMKDCMNHQY